MSHPAMAERSVISGSGWLAKERFQIRVRALGVVPAEDSSVSLGGTKLSEEIKVGNAFVPELDLTYFLTNNIAAEIIAGTARHEMDFGGSNLGEAWILPPTLTLQYHFTPDRAFSPYIGAGINYSIMYAEDAGTGFSDLNVDNGYGPALQAGFDYWINDNWGLNFDVKKIWLNVDASLNNGAIKADVELDPWLIGAGVSYRF
ncbi:MAG: OmpW family protein [Micavibrio aeruginosavorus]|uniref:OmpW family protein n=1 Tax=Micavibrio aeruginosavorus TaxID=349221 RepID=A0A2W4ZIT2_9BACT|nr:MAG: OmpW family protein [Micavibrio aeruginosavorus]